MRESQTRIPVYTTLLLRDVNPLQTADKQMTAKQCAGVRHAYCEIAEAHTYNIHFRIVEEFEVQQCAKFVACGAMN